MGLQTGRDLALHIRNGHGPPALVPLLGILTRRFHFEARATEVTQPDSAGGWRELVAGAGVRGLTVTAAGVLRNGEADRLIRDAFADQRLCPWQVTAPGLGDFAGDFLISQMIYLGTQDGEAQWEMTLLSAGPLSFTPQP